jgi:hypothetical protein
MRFNLLVWCVHSCRRDVFLEELARGNLPNFQSLVARGLFLSSAVVGAHFQRVSHRSEITGRLVTSAVSPAENILQSAARTGCHVGVANDFVIANWATALVKEGVVQSVEEIYPRLIHRPRFENIGLPKIDFRPDLDHPRWLYWYRERSTHRHFYNFALAFKEEGGLLEDIANEEPGFVRSQQRFSLRLQDAWLRNTLDHLREQGALDNTVIVAFSSHGTSAESWLPLMGRVTKATVDHTAFNFHPNVSRSFAIIAGPGVPQARIDRWVSILDLKPTLCHLLGIEDLGGSAYGVDVITGPFPEDRILADVSDPRLYSLYHPASGWLLMSIPPSDRRPAALEGLPPAPKGYLAFHLASDEACASPRTADFLDAPEMPAFRDEIRLRALRDPLGSR